MALSSKVSLLQFFDYCVHHNLPFAIYRLPESHTVKVVAQSDSTSKLLEKGKEHLYEKGFLFAPFNEDENYPSVIISPDIFTTDKNLPSLNFAKHSRANKASGQKKFLLKDSGKKQYKDYVKKIINSIKPGLFRKLVAARVVKKKKPENFQAVLFFKALCKTYPNTLVSLVYTKENGLWIGASPEILLNVDSNGFKTCSVAGTKANTHLNAKKPWGRKEIEEQELVSEHIIKAFATVSKEPGVIHGPVTYKAGNLLHLRTTFVFDSIPHSSWQKVVEQLHPTPAVAGLPKDEAIQFILKNEKSPRGYYSGYLGPLNLDRQINLFVNIRCMQVLKNKVAIYIGCGITKDSIPEDEWKESELKTETLLSVLYLPASKKNN